MSLARIDQAQQVLRILFSRVAASETVVITDHGAPVAELKPVAPQPKRLQPFDLCAGKFVVPDDFDAPWPAEPLDAFEGK